MSASTADEGGLTDFFVAKCRELDVTIATRHKNLRRLEAQRNELNARVRVRLLCFVFLFFVFFFCFFCFFVFLFFFRLFFFVLFC